MWLVVCCLFGLVGFWFLSLGKFVFNHKLTPVVDRPSLALVRQCRKKKISQVDWAFSSSSFTLEALHATPLKAITSFSRLAILRWIIDSEPDVQPRKVGAQWRDIPPEFVLVLPRLTIAKVRGKSYQDTLVVDNSTPEVFKHSISFTQPHLNPLLIVRRSSLHLDPVVRFGSSAVVSSKSGLLSQAIATCIMSDLDQNSLQTCRGYSTTWSPRARRSSTR